MKYLIFTMVFISCFVQYLLFEEGVRYKFKRNVCNKFNSKFIYNSSCHVQLFNRTAQLINLEVFLQPNVSLTDLRVEIVTFMKFGTVFRPSVIKFSDRFCDSLREGTWTSYIVQAMKSSYDEHSNLLQPCPKKGKVYIKDMLIDVKKFPKFFPIGEIRLDATVFTSTYGKEEFVILFQDYGEITPLGAEQF